MEFEQYKKVDAINASALKQGRKSLLHMHVAMTQAVQADTKAMKWGRLAHMAVLEPERFMGVARIFEGIKRGKEWEAVKAGSPDIDAVISQDEFDKLAMMRARIEANKMALDILGNTNKEQTMRWCMDTYGEAKGRMDACKRSMIVEYKTAKRIDGKSFAKQCVNLGYDLAVGWYHFGAKQCGLIDSDAMFIFIVQESEYPFDVAIYKAPKMMLEIGYVEAERIAKDYRKAEKSGIFPGVQADGLVHELEMPEWYGGDVMLEGCETMDMEDE